MRDFLLLVVGFVLTSVLGGFLGSYLQNRAWRNQHAVELREADRAAAIATCIELSRLLDTRLYRMRKLYWSLQQSADGTIDDENVRTQRSSYQEVLYQWNDALNRNLAMTETYFGSAVREFLENTIYEQFAGIGGQLDRAVRQQLRGEGGDDVKALSDAKFQSLSRHIYRFNIEMLSLIQAGAVGRGRTDGSTGALASQGTLRHGDTGSSVKRWQRDLQAQGLDVAEDGAFGSATEQATKAFQERSGLAPDGIVGDETRAVNGSGETWKAARCLRFRASSRLADRQAVRPWPVVRGEYQAWRSVLILSSQSERLVRATLPAFTERGTEITAVFYDTMFAAHPELLDVFNRGNQANGEQRQALAGSVVAFAAHLVGGDDPGRFEPMTRRIAHKHASLGIRPEQYAIVGRYLLGAVESVLGEAVDAGVHDAWTEVYWVFATALAAAEGGLYESSGVEAARPWRPWRVAGHAAAGLDVVALDLVPDDGGPIPEFRPGQYVTVNVELPDGSHQPRQYTLCQGPGRPSLQIAVGRQRGDAGTPDGTVSRHLHETTRVGDVLSVSHPFGDVTLDESDDPLLLISAGVGITPMAAIIDHLGRTRPGRPVVVAHADHGSATHPLRAQVREAARSLRHFQEFTWYGELTAADHQAGVRQGRIDIDSLPLADEAAIYVCGPLAFLSAVVDALLGRGLAVERIHYEIFGPDLFAPRLLRP